jgi:sugar lactone lactonase YvrE
MRPRRATPLRDLPRSVLGESPRYLDGDLWWVDIRGEVVHRLDLRNSVLRSVEASGVTAVCLGASGRVLVCAHMGVRVLGDSSPVVGLPKPPGSDLVRTNDARVDPGGRLWVGTMALDLVSPIAGLFRIAGGQVDQTMHGLVLSNGIDWTADGRSMYHIDSGRMTLDRYDFTPSGNPGARNILVEFEESDGLPDGIAVDAEDHVWVAVWGSGTVRRFAPNGRCVVTVGLPGSAFPTAVCLGGPRLTTLYITTATSRDNGGADGGYLYRIDVPVPGQPERVVRDL